MRWPKTLNRLEQHTLRELEQTLREIAELNQGLRQPLQGVSRGEELARLKRYEAYLLDDLRHIRERREAALTILSGGGISPDMTSARHSTHTSLRHPSHTSHEE